jgi:outer membrane protein assembly factor BamB
MGSEGSNNIKVFDENNGSLVWQYSTGNGARATSINVADGLALCHTEDKTLYCLNATTSQLLWTYSTGLNMTQPAVIDYRVFIGHYSADSKLLGVHCLSQSDGTLLWTREETVIEPPIELTLAVADGKTYWIHYQNSGKEYRMECLDEFSGGLEWNDTIMGTYSRVTPSVGDGKIFISSDDGYLRAFESTTGRGWWALKVGFDSEGKSASPSAVADGKLFVSTNNSVIALAANTGLVIWTYSVSGANPPIVADGYVMFSQSNAIYAVGSNLPSIPTPSPSPASTPIIPEFSSLVILPLLMTATWIAVMFCRRKRTRIRGEEFYKD